MDIQLQKKFTNCIDFEHSVFLTEPYIEHLMSRYGFRLEEKKKYLPDHSIFYAYIKYKNIPIVNIPNDAYSHNKEIFLDYINYYSNKIIPDINLRLDEMKEQHVFLFGASAFSQYLIGFGLNIENIICILDNDTVKHDKRLYGTNLKVESPNILGNYKNPIVILKAGAYDDEIRKDIINNINKNTVFI